MHRTLIQILQCKVTRKQLENYAPLCSAQCAQSTVLAQFYFEPVYSCSQIFMADSASSQLIAKLIK